MAYIEKRVTSKGEVRWRVQVRRNGAGVTKTFRSKMRATEWGIQTEAGITGESRPLAKHTVLEGIRRYAEEVSPGKRGGRWERVRLKAFEREPVDPFFRLAMAQTREEHVAGWRDRRLKAVGSSTVRREMNLLASVFERARKEWKWVRVNPFRDVEKPPEPPARRRGVKSGELEKLAKALTGPAGLEVLAGFELGIETGMRAGEMWGLGPEQINLEAGVAHLEKTKNGDERDVALSPRAIAIMRALLEDGRPTLFTVSNASRDALFRKGRDAAGVPDLHFHDSRAEAVVRLSKVLDVLELAEQIGHRDLKSLQSYYRQPASERATRLAAGAPRTRRLPPKRANAGARLRRSHGRARGSRGA